MTSASDSALAAILDWCADTGVEWEQASASEVVVVLPGEQKLRTTVSLSVAPDTVTVNAFVMRHPEENIPRDPSLAAGTQPAHLRSGLRPRSLRRRVPGRALPTSGFDTEVMDRLAGAVLLHADEVFNHLLELGFAHAITAEWRWRLEHGESTANLAAFEHLRPASGAVQEANPAPDTAH